MKGRVLVAMWLGCSACEQTTDPCPKGSEADRARDLCLPVGELPLDAGRARDAQASFDRHLEDASAPLNAGADAGKPGPSGDASQNAPDASPHTCSDEDVAAWAAFHQHQGVVATITGCLAQGCADASCAAATCIRSAAGVKDCEDCTYREALCAKEYCASACGQAGSDAECRACTCEAGCVSVFEACAGRPLNACMDAFGRDASVEELVLQGPWLVRAKSATGWLGTGPLAPFPPAEAAFSFNTHQSLGFDQLVSFTFDGRSYLLEAKSQCGDDPCIARISPLLRDGSLGRPVYSSVWTRGWDELEVFEMGGVLYLLRYKTGDVPADGEPSDSLRIERLAFTADRSTLELVEAHTESDAAPGAYPWSSFESFVVGTSTYLLRYGSARDGEVRLERLDVQGDQLQTTPVSKALTWSRGLDVVETFSLGTRSFVLTYKSGRLAPADDAAGSVRITSFVSAAGDVSFGPALYESTWPAGLTRVLPYQADDQNHLLLQNATTGDLSVWPLAADPAQWQSSLHVQSPDWTARWGTNPVWDDLDIARGQASAP